MKSKTLRRSSVTLLAAMAMVAMLALPATAGGLVVVVNCADLEADVHAMETQNGEREKKTQKDDAGLYFPGVGPARAFAWHLQPGLCEIVADVGNLDILGGNTGTIEALGYGAGWCGHSIGGSGKGWFDVATGDKAGDTVELTNIWWESAATVLFTSFKHSLASLTGNVPMLGNGRAIVAASAVASGNCQDDKKVDPNTGATTFTVNFTAVLH